MIKLSAVILSNTSSNAIFEMTQYCIQTLKESEQLNLNVSLEIILIESNILYIEQGYIYNDGLNIIVPDEVFNFHRFLNIGINEASGDYIALCNNDLIFSKNWFTEMMKVKDFNPEIMSFSPYDENSNRTSKEIIATNDFVVGYEIQKQMTGWCFVVNNKVFNKIGALDERFNFYYADNDYTMCLRKYNIKHALVTKSIVNHLGGIVTKEINKIETDFIKNFQLKELTNRAKIPKYVVKQNLGQILSDEKMIDGVIKYHQKWGHRKIIKLKLLIIEDLIKYKLGFLSKYILS
jgi:GT2 family glycosyltransferase